VVYIDCANIADNTVQYYLLTRSTADPSVLRIYALTFLNRLAAASFASITLVQFIIGLVVASTWNKSGMHQLYKDIWHLTYVHAGRSKPSLDYTCSITLNVNIELVYFALSLFFGGRFQLPHRCY